MKTPSKVLFVKLAIALVLIVAVMEGLKTSFLLAYDRQAVPSLEYRNALVWRHGGDIETLEINQVVVFQIDERLEQAFDPGSLFMKRVAGLPGDSVDVKETGVYINGEHVTDMNQISRIDADPNKVFRSYTVPEGQVFVLGTTPTSIDSRYWGTVNQDQIKGTVITLWSKT